MFLQKNSAKKLIKQRGFFDRGILCGYCLLYVITSGYPFLGNIFIANFIVNVISDPRKFTRDPRDSSIGLPVSRRKKKEHSRPVKNCRSAKKFSTHGKNLERSISILKGRICISLDGMTSGLVILIKTGS